jgi:ATP-dependent RNA helicase DBP3
MSNDIIMTEGDQVKVKKEKKEKKSKKSAQLDTPAESSVAPSETSTKEKKKKRKHEAVEESAEEVKSPETSSAENPEKKKKKAKDTVEATPASSEVATPAEGSEAPALSKKQLKKLAKAARAEGKATASETTGTSKAASVVEAPSSSDAELSTSSPSFLAAAASPESTKAFLSEQNITLTPPTYPAFLSMATLPINPSLRPYLSSFTKPTPIQSCSWPPLFVGRDVVGIAETGSGKTLSFGLPGMHKLATIIANGGAKSGNKGQILLLVLAPTRELALQTHETLSALGKLVGINAVCLFGGVNKGEQVAEIKKKNTRVVVGTPGRILDLAESREVDFSG